MAKVDLSTAKLYKLVASGANNKLALLVGVISSDPEKTLQHYLQHASVQVIEQPTYLPDASPNMSGIDLFIKERKDAPFYAIVNRLKQHFLEGYLLEDTKLRP
ncbi:MAG: hypothetical protein SFY68_14665 [Candidatus Sumerlaeia bacterium]|nr:hypothetical protein [Candidatus Sumerlaeia bacterium]